MKQEMNIYFTNQHLSTSNEKLIEMLYDGLIKFLSQAIISIKNNDIEQKCNKISKSIAILDELIKCLDFKYGNVAFYLNGLYNYQIKTLFNANIKNDINSIEETLNVIKTLREVWKEQ